MEEVKKRILNKMEAYLEDFCDKHDSTCKKFVECDACVKHFTMLNLKEILQEELPDEN